MNDDVSYSSPGQRQDAQVGEALRAYRRSDLSVAAPPRVLFLLLETGIRACRTGKRGLLHRTLTELLASLDLEHEPAQGLLSLYEYLIFLSREGRVDEVQSMLEELLDTWKTALARTGGRT